MVVVADNHQVVEMILTADEEEEEDHRPEVEVIHTEEVVVVMAHPDGMEVSHLILEADIVMTEGTETTETVPRTKEMLEMVIQIVLGM